MAASGLGLALCAHIEGPSWVIGWVALVPWLALLDGAASARAALVAALPMAVAYVLAVFWWFAPAVATYTGAPIGLALLGLLLGAPLLEPQLFALALGRHVARADGFWWATFTGAALYVGVEWASPKLFVDTLGHGLYASVWLRQAADLAGAPGLTLLLVVGNECVLAALRAVRGGPARAALAPAVCLAALLTGLALYGAVRCRQLGSEPGTMTAALVQADVARYDRLAAEQGTYDAVQEILNLHFALSGDALRRGSPELLLWPETVYPTTFGSPKSEDGAAFDRAIAAFVAGARVPLVFGAYDVEDGQEYNAAVFLEPSTSSRLMFETYRKTTLFPLTERVPAVLDRPVVRRWLPWLGSWKPGAGAVVIPVRLADGRTVRVGPLICYDDIEPRLAIEAVRRGAEVIVTLSNDSWFAVGGGPHLHLVGSAFRSIETRRPQLRATNTGISAVIAPDGALLATAGVHERVALLGAITPESHAWTLMLAWGDWLGPTALVVGVTLLAVARGRGSRPTAPGAPLTPRAGGRAVARRGDRTSSTSRA